MPFNTEKRPDIAVAIENDIYGGAAHYIATRVFPEVQTREKGGTIALAQRLADGGTKGRSWNESLSGTHVAPVDVNYSTSLYEGRAFLSESDVTDLGGDDKAVAAGAKISSRGALGKAETDASDAVFTTAAVANAVQITSADGFDGLLEAAQSVKGYGREPVLVASESFWRKWIALPNVRETLTELYGHGIIGNAVRGLPETLESVGAAFGCARVEIGDDDFWQKHGAGALSAAEYAAVINLPTEAQDEPLVYAKSNPVFGIAPTFIPQDGSKYEIETGYDVSTKRNIVDSTVRADFVVANDAARKCVYIA